MKSLHDKRSTFLHAKAFHKLAAERESQLQCYRGTPDVITPGYVLGAAGTATRNAVKAATDTWLVQRAVSTATPTGGELLLPTTSDPGVLGPIADLQHYTFKMDPTRGLHIIRQQTDQLSGASGGAFGSSHPTTLTPATLHGPQVHLIPTSLATTVCISALVQATLGLGKNIWRLRDEAALEEDSLSRSSSASSSGSDSSGARKKSKKKIDYSIAVRDIATDFVRDNVKGTVVGTGYWGVLRGINIAQGSSVGTVKTVARCLALNPTPALMTSLGSTYIAARYFMYLNSWLTHEQVLADAVFASYSNGLGALACLAGAQLGFSPALCALVGCLAGTGLASYTYECWREESGFLLCKKLRTLATKTLGLPENFDAELVNRRFRTLARWAHPDRNTNPGAKGLFESLQLSKEICLQDLDGYRGAKDRMDTLWRYLYAEGAEQEGGRGG